MGLVRSFVAKQHWKKLPQNLGKPRHRSRQISTKASPTYPNLANHATSRDIGESFSPRKETLLPLFFSTKSNVVNSSFGAPAVVAQSIKIPNGENTGVISLSFSKKSFSEVMADHLTSLRPSLVEEEKKKKKKGNDGFIDSSGNKSSSMDALKVYATMGLPKNLEKTKSKAQKQANNSNNFAGDALLCYSLL